MNDQQDYRLGLPHENGQQSEGPRWGDSGALTSTAAPHTPDPESPDASVHLDNELQERLKSLLDTEAVKHLRQMALLNLGEMNALKVNASFENPLDHNELSDTYLDALRTVYVRPEGGDSFDDIYGWWRNPGSVVVLAQKPSTGRTATACALLAELRHEFPAVRVGPLGFGGGLEFPVRRLPQVENRGYLLELPPDEDGFKVASTFGATIERLQYTLKRRSARLVVLTTPEQWRRVGGSAPDGIKPSLGAPSPLEIARKWLGAEGPPDLPVEQWLTDDDIVALLNGQPPVEALEIVSLILDAHHARDSSLPNLEALARKRKNGADTPFDRQVLSVIAARNNWRPQLLSWHKESGRTSFQRNFLLACATLRGASVAHVYASTATLASVFGDSDPSLEGQQDPGVIEMVDSIGAELQADDTITFNRPEWDDAALEYFWVDRPLSRVKFLEWLADAPLKKPKAALETLTDAERQAMAERIGSFALRWAVRHRRQEPLRQLVRRWHDTPLWTTAVELLTSACLQTASGSYIHEMLLQWARTDNAAQQLATVEVCAGEFGVLYTGKALRRLRHAAGSGDGEVRQALQKAVHGLWSDPSARRTLFGYVIDWCRDGGTKLEAGQAAFRALAESTHPDAPTLPALLPHSDEAEFTASVTDLIVGWRALFQGTQGFERDGQASAVVRLWLDAALSHPHAHADVLKIFSAAVKLTDPTGTSGENARDRLRATAREWAKAAALEQSAGRIELPSAGQAHRAVYTELAQLLDDGIIETFQQTLAQADSEKESA
ncbi:hypothetical protein [Streptomyces formicae]|uniref:hypothetical protein n=1 Tax=Streptomyces formicae TaxID=1616117 RepID=UPI001F33BF84|nr:hypothetical protein [Streptomyces formicae]